MEALLQSLETNSDIMDSMLHTNMSARKAFEDKIDCLRNKLVETVHRKRQQAERDASFFFGAFESDLDEFSKQVRITGAAKSSTDLYLVQIRRIEEHFVQTYRAHIRDERTFLQEQCTAVTSIQDETSKVFHEQVDAL